jgi:NAD(P)-dependent dehydrogenase (short-subunit alcohol dehydrogenase family)
MISSISKTIKTILVTGSNKGIGYGILRGLLLKDRDYNLILTARDEERGNESFRKLTEEFKNKSDKIFFHQLDITDSDSIKGCFEWIKNTFGQIDILVDNAAVATKGNDFNVDVYNYTFPINVDGTINFTERIIDEDLISKGGKVVILGSMAGTLARLGENIRKEFMDENLTLEGLFDLSRRFKQSIIDNKVIENGWTQTAYGTTKMIINTYARVLSKRKEINERNIGVYVCNPGWVKTDMAGDRAPLTIEEGVLTPIYLIELEDGIHEGLQGKYFNLCKVDSYYDIKF